jgi:hypothetical protein
MNEVCPTYESQNAKKNDWNILADRHHEEKNGQRYLYETDESVKNGHGPFNFVIRAVSNSYSVQ